MLVKEDTKLILNSQDFGRYSALAGGLLIILGLAGIFLPEFVSLEATLLFSSLLFIGGIFWFIHTIKVHNKKWAEWQKPVLLFSSGGLILFYPMMGIATIGLLLATYLLIDAYGSFFLAYAARHNQGWVWMAVNGITSLVLGSLFLFGWPASSLFLVGLYISISLFFDGIALLSLSWTQH